LTVPSPLERRPVPQPHSFSFHESACHQLCAYALCATPALSRSCAIPSFSSHRGYLIIAEAQRRGRKSISQICCCINQISISAEECSLALHPPSTSSVPVKRLSSSQAHPSESPARKNSRNGRQTKMRRSSNSVANGMKWEDISKQLPGRSAISCRLHYQNYLERQSEWDEDRKNKLARLYEREVKKRGTRSILCNRS
jgi:hypothetical protein